MKILSLAVTALFLVSPLAMANDKDTSEHMIKLEVKKDAQGKKHYNVKHIEHKNAKHEHNEEVETLFPSGAAITTPSGMRIMMG